MRNIDTAIIHCAATVEGKDLSASDIKKWHLKRGWSDIGYHFVVKLDGSIEEGRPMERQGAHAKGYNKNSIGICYIGGLDENKKPKDTRTPAQKESLDNLLSILNFRYELKYIYGHNKVSSKACPCFDAETEYNHHTCY